MAKKSSRKAYIPSQEEMDANVWTIQNDYKIVSLPTDNTHREYYVQVKKGNKVWRSPETYNEYQASIEMYKVITDLYNRKK